tara:strand:- start:181 stop:348 length:168 start_codon:yes stop_codon:yes gene_type:complete
LLRVAPTGAFHVGATAFPLALDISLVITKKGSDSAMNEQPSNCFSSVTWGTFMWI